MASIFKVEERDDGYFYGLKITITYPNGSTEEVDISKEKNKGGISVMVPKYCELVFFDNKKNEFIHDAMIYGSGDILELKKKEKELEKIKEGFKLLMDVKE